MNPSIHIRKKIVAGMLIGLFCIAGQVQAQKYSIRHLDPPGWWIGMHNPQLMLMINGPKISDLTPSINYKGVSVTTVTRTENPDYLFVFLKISKDADPGKFPVKFSKNGKVVLTADYELKQRKAGSAARKGFSQQDEIYLLMPDRFANGDTTNDSVKELAEKVNRKDPNGRHGGDIQGIIDHLDYLKDLGIKALWSTPLLEDNMPVYSYHGYATTDYYKIDARYGTNEDYKRLAEECHRRGIKLIMDMVPNHCGSDHWWMKDLPMKDWVHQFPEFTRTNYRISTWNDPHAAEIDRKLNEDGWFDVTMPDLNQNNPFLLTYLEQNAIYWIEYADLDGVRVDTYPYTNEWKIADWTKAILNEYPNLNIMGECWMHRPSEVAYWQSGVKNYNGYNSYLPTVMDFPLNDAFQAAFNQDYQNWGEGVGMFYNNYVMDYLYARPLDLLIFADNHDTPRFSTEIGFDVNKFRLGMIHLLTTRGIPEILYGTEIMMGGEKSKGDGDIRRDFPGGWPNDKRDAFTPQGRTEKENEAYNVLHSLLKYRNENPVLQTGKMIQYIPQGNVYVYFRMNDTKTVMVVMNNSTEETKLNTGRFSECIKGAVSGVNILNGSKVNLTDMDVAAKTGMVIELDK